METKTKIYKTVDLAYEVGSLRNIKRLWAQVLGPSVANNLEHSYRVIFLALTICRMEGKGDESKILKMALLHDLCETRSTDIAFFHRPYVERKENEASQDQLGGTFLERDLPILEEYKKRESIESRIVKDADDLEVDMELSELSEKGNSVAKNFIDKNRQKIKDKLYTDSAKSLWEAIYEIKPDNWQAEITHSWVLNRKK